MQVIRIYFIHQYTMKTHDNLLRKPQKKVKFTKGKKKLFVDCLRLPLAI